MNIKNIFRVIIFWAWLLPCCVMAAPTHLDKIVAVVDSGVVTQSDLDSKIAITKKQMARGQVAEPKATVMREQVLNNLVDISLQLQLAERNGIQVEEKELDAIIAGIAKDNGLTVAQFKQSVPEHEGISFNEFRRQIHEQILLRRVQQQFLGKDIVVSNKEINEFLGNQPKLSNIPAHYHVVDILFEVADATPQAKLAGIEKVARKVAVKLQQGADVEAVVKESQGSLGEQIVHVNDLGWRKVGELPALFAKEITKMTPNQTIGPLNAPNGLHLIKLLGSKGAPGAAKFTKDQAVEIIYQSKIMEKVKPWLDEIRAKAYIKIIK